MYYSQFREDEILNGIFQNKKNGICIEVGANNGVDDSTTFFFEKIGWKCVLVEPNPFLCERVRNSRKALVFECAASNFNGIETLHVVEGAERADGLSTISSNPEDHNRFKSLGFTSSPVQVQTMTLDEILTSASMCGDIDFMTIDVEGHEYEVLEGFSLEKWRPAIILVEDNSNFENNRVSKYLKNSGYTRFRRTGVNDWYAHRTNRQLVNIRSKMLIGWTIFKTRLKTRKVSLKNKIKVFLCRVRGCCL